jgi:hypothetical protein
MLKFVGAEHKEILSHGKELSVAFWRGGIQIHDRDGRSRAVEDHDLNFLIELAKVGSRLKLTETAHQKCKIQYRQDAKM